MNRKSLLLAGLFFVLFLGGLFLLGFNFRDLDWTLIRQTAPGNIVLILISSFISIGIYSLEVLVLLSANDRTISLWKAYLVLTASMSTNYVTPVKIGIPLRVYLYNQIFGINYGAGSALVAIEAVMGLVVPILLAVPGIILLFNGSNIAILIVAITLIVLCMIGFLILKPASIGKILRRLFSKKFGDRVETFVYNLQSGLKKVKPRTLLMITILLIMNFLVTSWRLYLIMESLGGELSFLKVFFARVISITAGSLSMIPMGLGVRDASVTFLLSSLGLSRDIAVTTALVERLFSPGFPLLLGLISANILGIRQLKMGKDNKSEKNN